MNDLATTDPDLADAWTRAGRHDRHFDLSADDLNPRSPWLIAWLNRDQDDVDQATTSDGR